jgi:hypothetical protein
MAALLLGAASTAMGRDIPLTKILPDDGAADDFFGRSLAIDGGILIAGAYRDDDNGDRSGAAYLFDTVTGTQTAKLLPDDGDVRDYFGFNVAIDGSTAIVGAFGDDDNGDFSGSAYLFDTATGTQIAKLLPSDGAPEDFFGDAVAVDGAIAIVGAPDDDDNGDGSGSAYLFDAVTGTQITKLLPDDGEAGDGFGRSVALDGSIAIIGAPGGDDSGGDSGSAYLFDIITGTQIAKLLPNDGQPHAGFGYSVSIDGSVAIVGVPFDPSNGWESGSAYLFDGVTGMQIAKLLPDDGEASEKFGISVGISGSTAIVGAPFDDDRAGSAYLFDIITGTQTAKLLASDGADDDEFGDAVAIDQFIAGVGAPLDDDHGVDSGSAYLAYLEPSVDGDLNGDGCVDLQDLGILLAAWNADDGGDLDGDGDTDLADLGILLANWGAGC